jgi:hypothetical protein
MSTAASSGERELPARSRRGRRSEQGGQRVAEVVRDGVEQGVLRLVQVAESLGLFLLALEYASASACSASFISVMSSITPCQQLFLSGVAEDPSLVMDPHDPSVRGDQPVLTDVRRGSRC